MFQYLLAFLLINSYYQSLGNPVQSSPLISESLSDLAKQCENGFLSNAIKSKVNDCAVSVPPYHKKQIRCLIFYDINKQLCAAVAASKISLPNDEIKMVQKQEVINVCQSAKDWVFTNIPEYPSYKNSSEVLLKSPVICGEVCGVEETMNEANDFCKYYKWGIELLKSQPTPSANTNGAEISAIQEPDSNPRADIAVPRNENSFSPQLGETKTSSVITKQTESAVGKSTPGEKTDESIAAAQKSTSQATASKQPSSQDNVPSADKSEDTDVNVNEQEHQIDLPDVGSNDQANKSTVTNQSKLEGENDPAPLLESGKDAPLNIDNKDTVLEKMEGKSPIDPDEYADSDGNDAVDDEGDDPRPEIKSGLETKQDNIKRTKIVETHPGDASQKDYYPSTDGFSDDGDHFFPFFLTAIILVVLLYVLYHNKNKVSKLFFGLILEGRQSGRRRNSRGHAYRRLDTLEQAMSANTAAPPSKIIY